MHVFIIDTLYIVLQSDWRLTRHYVLLVHTVSDAADATAAASGNSYRP